MTSPLASLRKPRKAPLPGVHQAGQRTAPFRNPIDICDNEEFLLDDILGRSVSQQSGVSTSRSDTFGSRANKHLPKLNKDSKTAPSDYDLMSSMMSRIAQLELKVQYYTKEIIDKDKKISIQEEKMKLFQKYKGDTNTDSDKVRNLEKKCLELQKTIQDMEDFLSDYGMIWVGNSTDDDAIDGDYEVLSQPINLPKSTSMWRPGASVVLEDDSTPFHVNFDLIIKNIKELNVVAGDGEKRILHTVNGARFVAPDTIPLSLYSNGIFMFNGPFRSYEEPTTQHCVQDFMDGYFPFELKDRFPDGVPFKVTDKRDTIYNDPSHIEQFPGAGNLVGGENKPSRLVPTNLDKGTSMDKSYTTSHDGQPVYETSEPPHAKLSMDQFLNKLPLSIMKEGKVIDVRASLAKELKHDSSNPSVTIIDTPAVQEILERVSNRPQSSLSSRPPSAQSSITTLRVKSETGEHTFILKMRYLDTIGDVRRYLDVKRPPEATDYEIITTFPAKVYDNQDATLKECSLTPNATLHLRAKKK